MCECVCVYVCCCCCCVQAGLSLRSRKYAYESLALALALRRARSLSLSPRLSRSLALALALALALWRIGPWPTVGNKNDSDHELFYKMIVCACAGSFFPSRSVAVSYPEVVCFQTDVQPVFAH